MKRIVRTGILIVLAAAAGCAHWQKKEKALVQHQASVTSFTGYKVTAKVKASAADVDRYILDLGPFNVETDRCKLKMDSENKIEKLGDSADFRVEVARVPFPGKFILVRHKPGEEIWYVAQIQQSVMAVLRVGLTPMDEWTRLTIQFEWEDTNSLLTQIAEVINVPQMLAGLLEKGVAKGQTDFDPSLNSETLLEKGLRGEFYSTFYQKQAANIWINASPARVDDYLRDPATWQGYKAKYMIDLDGCPAAADSSPCPIQLKFLGIDYDVNSFLVSSKPAEQTISYWVPRQMIARFQTRIKPEQAGARLFWAYTIELPSAASQEGASLLINMVKIPDTMEKMLLDAKTSLEATD